MLSHRAGHLRSSSFLDQVSGVFQQWCERMVSYPVPSSRSEECLYSSMVSYWENHSHVTCTSQLHVNHVHSIDGIHQCLDTQTLYQLTEKEISCGLSNRSSCPLLLFFSLALMVSIGFW